MPPELRIRRFMASEPTPADRTRHGHHLGRGELSSGFSGLPVGGLLMRPARLGLFDGICGWRPPVSALSADQRARRVRDMTSRCVFLRFCFNAWLAYESVEDTDRQMITEHGCSGGRGPHPQIDS
jgi:hypothetical protein